MTKLRVLVCGGRNYTDVRKVASVLGELWHYEGPLAIIQGGARGADTLAAGGANLAPECSCETYPADWKMYGVRAGPIRNQRMIDEGKLNLVVAFPGGRGTTDMVNRAKKNNIEVIEVKSDGK